MDNTNVVTARRSVANNHAEGEKKMSFSIKGGNRAKNITEFIMEIIFLQKVHVQLERSALRIRS